MHLQPINIQNAPEGFDITSAVVYPEFVTDGESKSLIKEASKRLKRRRFENGHWDSVITGYREVEMSTPDEVFSQNIPQEDDNNKMNDDAAIPMFAKVIQETRRHLENHHFGSNNGDNGCIATSRNIRWLPCHAIDLSANGELSAHVDSVKFSGEIVAGISLLSDSIMRLRPSSNEWDGEDKNGKLGGAATEEKNCGISDGYVDLYLPQLSLYVLSGMSRYSYTHELLPSGSIFEFLDVEESYSQCEPKNREVVRGRRLSVIFRDEHNKSISNE